jgi:hypothetical protein
VAEPAFVVFADDWGRHPSSCQHLFRHLLPRHPTWWVNTIGMRPPRLDRATLQRVLEKMRQWLRRGPPPAALPPNLHVSNPRMWPWFRTSLDRRINRGLLARHLKRLTRSLPAPPVAVTTIPVVADLVSLFPAWRWVYYCVDDFGEWPGVDGEPMKRMEVRLIRECHTIVTVSQPLRERVAALGRSSQLLTHGVDLGHWAGGADDPFPEAAGLERPLVVFWGVTDRRTDVAWVRALAGGLGGGTVLLVGPQADPDPALLQTPRVAALPPVPYERLPALARQAAVLVMPYADLPVTRAMQPLKLKEYLATLKPAVARDLPASRDWADCLDLASTPDEFVALVRQRIETGLPAEQRAARRRLQSESWEEKARQFEAWALGG